MGVGHRLHSLSIHAQHFLLHIVHLLCDVAQSVLISHVTDLTEWT